MINANKIFDYIKIMKNIKETCIEFFKNEDIKKDIRDVIKPLGLWVYNEIYVYLWILCIYNVFLFFIVLAILFILLHMLRKNYTFQYSVN